MRSGRSGSLLAIATFLLLACVALAADGTFDVPRWTVDGGGGTSSGGAYSLTGTSGQAGVGALMQGGAYELAGGFWGAAGQAEYDLYLPVVMRTRP
jgi:hypothetical protein